MNSKDKKEESAPSGVSRKDFLKSAGLATAGFFVVPRHVLGGAGYTAPSDKLNIACIGVGGMGKNNTAELAELGENIYALCDVDEKYAAEVFEKYPKAKKYVNYRDMLEQEPEIDAVMVATPDNTHAAIAIPAMQMGKHAFVQKPLTRTIYEARRMAEVAKESGVVTQMGNQGHCFEGTHDIVEWIRGGAIGSVDHVDCWTDRPRGWWPQGGDVSRPEQNPPVPSTMQWDLWLGPSPYRQYNPVYAPFAWRGRWDFGSGALGDMGAHILDQPYWALDLDMPETVHASTTPLNDEAFPTASSVHFQFAAKGDRAPVKINWFDGGLMPPRPDELADDQMMGSDGGGMIFYGSEGMLMADLYGHNPRFIPSSYGETVGAPPTMLEPSPGIHEEWVKACKGNGTTSSNFDYAAALTETMLVGNLALRFSDSNKKLQWDAENMRVKNLQEANDWLAKRRDFREGWGDIIG